MYIKRLAQCFKSILGCIIYLIVVNLNIASAQTQKQNDGDQFQMIVRKAYTALDLFAKGDREGYRSNIDESIRLTKLVPTLGTRSALEVNIIDALWDAGDFTVAEQYEANLTEPIKEFSYFAVVATKRFRRGDRTGAIKYLKRAQKIASNSVPSEMTKKEWMSIAGTNEGDFVRYLKVDNLVTIAAQFKIIGVTSECVATLVTAKQMYIGIKDKTMPSLKSSDWQQKLQMKIEIFQHTEARVKELRPWLFSK